MSRRAVVVLLHLCSVAGASAFETEAPPQETTVLGRPSTILEEARDRRTFAAEAGAPLYAAPDPHAPPLRYLDFDVELEVLEELDGWVRVEWRDVRGWLRTEAAELADDSPLAPLEVLEAPEAAEWSPVANKERLRRALDLLGDAGFETRLGPFTLLSDVRQVSTLERFGEVLGELPAAYRERLGLAPRLDVETAIVLFDSETKYREYERDLEIGDAEVAGHAGRGVAALFVGGRPIDEVQSVLIHEVSHLLNRLALGRDLPAWLEEGLANDLAYCKTDADGRLLLGTLGGRETTRSGRRRTTIVEVYGGRAALQSLVQAEASRRLLPTRLLVDLAWREFVDADGREARYIQAAFLTRFLLDGRRGTHAEPFRLWLAALAGGRGRGPLDLFEYITVSPEELDRQFSAWIRAQGHNPL